MKNIAVITKTSQGAKDWPNPTEIVKGWAFLLLVLISLLYTGGSVARADITSGLVGWWSFDDGKGTSVQDSGSGANNGTIYYPYGSWVIGKVWEYALLFSNNTSVSAGSTSSYSFVQNTKIFTISAWFKLTDYTASGDQTILANNHHGEGPGFYLYYHNVSGSVNGLQFQLQNSNGTIYITVPNVIKDDNWHQVIITGDGTNAQIYLDGTAIGPLTAIGSTASGASFNPLMFGYTSGYGAPFSGTIDDLRIYNRTLSTSDIASLYAFVGAGAPPVSNGTSPTTDFYVAQNWTGNGSGTSCANAQNMAWLNSSAAWGTSVGQIGPGSTVHLCGNITTNITVQGSGTSVHPITIFFSPGATMSQPTWSGAIINVTGQSYIVIDGGATGQIGGYNGNPGLANGIIESTNNGTGPTICVPNTSTCGTYTYQNTPVGVYGNPASHITVQNLVIANLYVRLAGTNDDGAGGTGVYSGWNGAGVETDWTVNNCIFHDMQIGFSIDYSPGTQNFTYSNSTAYNVSWGGNAGDGDGGASMTNLVVKNNYFHDFNPWNSPDDHFHENGFFAWSAQSGSVLNDTTYNGNVITNFGANNSSGLFIQGVGTTGTYNFYNNLIIVNGNGPHDGSIYVSNVGNGSHTKIYNNTLIGAGNGINFGEFEVPTSNSLDIENNIFIEGTAIDVFDSSTLNFISNHNVFYNLSSWVNPQGVSDGLQDQAFGYQTAPGADNTAFDTPTGWRAYGFDANSQFNLNPNLNTNNVPQSPSPAIGNGVNFSSYFTTDLNGNARPSSGAWDVGALMSGSTVSTYTLTVATAGSGFGEIFGTNINCGANSPPPPNVCSATVNAGTVETLTETPATGSTFTGWSGACSGTGSCSVTMNSTQNVTASFASSTVNGACGAASQTYLYQSTGFGDNALCKSGTPSPSTVAFPAPGGVVTWTCVGSSGGLNSSCKAKRNSRTIVKLL